MIEKLLEFIKTETTPPIKIISAGSTPKDKEITYRYGLYKVITKLDEDGDPDIFIYRVDELARRRIRFRSSDTSPQRLWNEILKETNWGVQETKIKVLFHQIAQRVNQFRPDITIKIFGSNKIDYSLNEKTISTELYGDDRIRAGTQFWVNTSVESATAELISALTSTECKTEKFLKELAAYLMGKNCKNLALKLSESGSGKTYQVKYDYQQTTLITRAIGEDLIECESGGWTEAVSISKNVAEVGDLIMARLKEPEDTRAEAIKLLKNAAEYVTKQYSSPSLRIVHKPEGSAFSVDYCIGNDVYATTILQANGMLKCHRAGNSTYFDATEAPSSLGDYILQKLPKTPIVFDEIQKKVLLKLNDSSVKSSIDTSFALPVLKFSKVTKKTVRVTPKDSSMKNIFVEDKEFEVAKIDQIVDFVCSFYKTTAEPTVPESKPVRPFYQPPMVAAPARSYQDPMQASGSTTTPPVVQQPVVQPVPIPVPVQQTPMQTYQPRNKGLTNMATQPSLAPDTTTALQRAMTAGAEMAVVNEAYSLLVNVAIELLGDYPFVHAFLKSDSLLARIVVGLLLPTALIFLCDNVEVPQKAQVRAACLLVLQAQTFTTLSPLLAKLGEPLKKLAAVGAATTREE